MKFYLAARYSRKEELKEYKKQLETLGHTVTSRWLLSDEVKRDGVNEYNVEDTNLEENIAKIDLDDIKECDIIVCFTEEPRKHLTRGGRHVEFGIGIGLEKQLVNIGHLENDFYYLKEIKYYYNWKEYISTLIRDHSDVFKTIKELKERIEQAERLAPLLEYVSIGLYEMVKDNDDLRDNNGEVRIVIDSKATKSFYKSIGVNIDMDQDNNCVIRFKDKQKIKGKI